MVNVLLMIIVLFFILLLHDELAVFNIDQTSVIIFQSIFEVHACVAAQCLHLLLPGAAATEQRAISDLVVLIPQTLFQLVNLNHGVFKMVHFENIAEFVELNRSVVILLLFVVRLTYKVGIHVVFDQLKVHEAQVPFKYGHWKAWLILLARE